MKPKYFSMLLLFCYIQEKFVITLAIPFFVGLALKLLQPAGYKAPFPEGKQGPVLISYPLPASPAANPLSRDISRIPNPKPNRAIPLFKSSSHGVVLREAPYTAARPALT